MQIVSLVCTAHPTLLSWPPLELYGDGRAQSGVGGLRGLHHLHHQCPQHVLQQTAHRSPCSSHWIGGAQWEEAQVPGPAGVGMGRAWLPGVWKVRGPGPCQARSVRKESRQETCVVCFCLWVKRKESLRRQNQHGDHWLSASRPRFLKTVHAFGQNWKGCTQEVLVMTGFLIFQTSEIWLCRREHPVLGVDYL